MKEKVDMRFQIKNIELVEVKIYSAVHADKQGKTFHYNINLEHRIIPEKKWLINMVSVGVFGEDKETKLGNLKVAISFEINNFDDFADKAKSHVEISDEILSLFNSIAISTVRGVMFAQFRGTHLHNAILPIVDSGSFRKE